MNAPPTPARTDYPDAPLYIVLGLAVAAGLPTALLAALLARQTRCRPIAFALAAAAGAALAVVLFPVWRTQVAGALAAITGDAGLGRAAPQLLGWWLAGLCTVPTFAVALELARPRTVDDHRRQLERRTDRRRARGERRAAKHATKSPPHAEGQATLGRHISGDKLLPVHRGWATLPLDRLARHMLVLGASGSGKTQTLLRIVYSVATAAPDWSIYYIDGKGDRDNGRRFAALLASLGRRPRLFPDDRYDGWRGDAQEVANRLIELIDYADEGGATWYRDLGTNLIRLACHAPGGPPRSADELRARLNLDQLRRRYQRSADQRAQDAATELSAYEPRQAQEVALRYQAFFGAVNRTLDGDWAYEDTDAAYLALDGLRLKHEAGGLARFLIEDFTQYVTGRKPLDKRVLLIVDEFSAIAVAGSALVDVVERTRSFGVAAILAPQVVEGMGGDEAAARIIGSSHTTLLHAVPDPERIVAIAGTRLAVESSVQHDRNTATGMGSARIQHAFRVDPNEVRQLPPGACFAIGSGRAQKLHVATAPQLARAAQESK